MIEFARKVEAALKEEHGFDLKLNVEGSGLAVDGEKIGVQLDPDLLDDIRKLHGPGTEVEMARGAAYSLAQELKEVQGT